MKSGISKTMGMLLILLLCFGEMPLSTVSNQLCKITFVPIGNFPATSLQKLASYYEKTLGLRIDIQPTIPFQDAMVDRSRGQLIGEAIISRMKS